MFLATGCALSKNASMVNAVDAYAAVSGVLDGSWDLISFSDNLVFASSEYVIKIGVRPDSRSRLENGVLGAVKAKSAGACALEPIGGVVDTPLGPVSLWPRLQDPRRLDPQSAAVAGRYFSYLPSIPVTSESLWDPFVRVKHRLEKSTLPVDAERMMESLVQLSVEKSPLQGKLVFTHGDASFSNILNTPKGPVLIDFDSCGARPYGWDLACLKFSSLESSSGSSLFEAVLSAWSELRRVPDRWEEWVQVKAVLATSFMMTLPPSPQLEHVFWERCKVLRTWLTLGDPPESFPTYKPTV